ncbi:MAG TPA: hypothetical protein VGM54_25870 [Chthoniobacter sp.]|jgi:predicted DNA-binding transcriptional regulator AlpA
MNEIESKHVWRAGAGEETPRLRPEWLRIPEAVRLFGLGRSALYELLAEGKVESMAFRKPGATRGVRLIRYDSLAQYVERAAQEGGVAR